MQKNKTALSQRLSLAEKEADGNSWYKAQADLLDTHSQESLFSEMEGISNKRRMKVNYDLFNNILDLGDFSYVCTPYGAEVGELPAKMVNRDIVSPKIKAVLGSEMKRPFEWRVIATNSEATTQRERTQTEKIKNFVVSQVMLPIRKQVEEKYQEQLANKELTEEDRAKISKQVEDETKSMTPDEVLKYMEREHQEPVEVMSHQLLEYLTQKCQLKRKFNTGFKHGLLSAREIYYIGAHNGHPDVWNVNSLRFNCDKSQDEPFIEDSEWATCEYRFSPSKVIELFGEELGDEAIDEIYEAHQHYTNGDISERAFDFSSFNDDTENDQNTVRVLHCVWKSLRKIGFLAYVDEDGEEQERIVDEGYKLNKEYGDLSVTWQWFPEVYETWKIGTDKYAKMQPVPGQFKDLDNLHYCKLPYCGVLYDNMNSKETALMDRIKVYQYYYNIVLYRLELALASDKGKKLLMNINMIPDDAAMDIEKWMYYFESSPYAWYNPDQEGSSKNYNDANTVAKVLDMSMVSDIKKYMEIAEYLRQQCGRSVGITDAVEGEVSPSQSASSARQNLSQSNNIIEPYYEMHNYVKGNVLQALIECAKVTYQDSDKQVLSYVLDDMSRQVLTLDMGMLDNSTLGIFVSNSGKAQEIKNAVVQLSHAAMQNQKAELSDIIKILKTESITEVEETLKVAEKRASEQQMAVEQQRMQAAKEEKELERGFIRESHAMEIEKIKLQGEEKRKTEVVKGAFIAASFNADQDSDNDGKNDFLELIDKELDVVKEDNRLKLDQAKLAHQKETDKRKLDIEEKKLSKKAIKSQ